MSLLPSFLRPLPLRESRGPYFNAVFDHKQPLGSTHALWWPPQRLKTRPETVVLFIPGNPGLVDFYTPFLTALRDKDTSETLAILAHAHIGHTPGIGKEGISRTRYGLLSQVQNAIEAFDTLCSEFSQAKIVLIGHSVGAWVALQVLKSRADAISGLFLLFPTLCQIRDTPNGRKLSIMFRPITRRIITRLSYVIRFIPSFVLQRLFLEWPIAQLQVLREFLVSLPSISASLRMADHEMQMIRDLDTDLLREHHNKLWFYFAEKDDWVGEQRDHILSHFTPDTGTLRITRGDPDIPHAFCINHGEVVAQQCYRWLLDIDP